MNIKEAIITRRTVRSFSEEQVGIVLVISPEKILQKYCK